MQKRTDLRIQLQQHRHQHQDHRLSWLQYLRKFQQYFQPHPDIHVFDASDLKRSVIWISHGIISHDPPNFMHFLCTQNFLLEKTSDDDPQSNMWLKVAYSKSRIYLCIFQQKSHKKKSKKEHKESQRKVPKQTHRIYKHDFTESTAKKKVNHKQLLNFLTP